MGNKIIEKINQELEEINKLILQEDYQGSKDKFKIMLDDLKKNDSTGEDEVNYLLLKINDYKTRLKFQTIIGNLKKEHKFIFLFKLIYEQYLINSIENKNEHNNNNNKNKTNNNNESEETKKENIIKKIQKMAKIEEYLSFVYFKSILYEKMAEKYFELGAHNYSAFNKKNGDSSEELQEIIATGFQQCLDNYKETFNYQKLFEHYNDSLKKVISHQQLLFAFEKFKKEEFLEALGIFEKINYNNDTINKQKNDGIFMCYKYLAEKEEKNKNYEKALEYFNIIKNKTKIFEMNVLINETKIFQCIKEKQYKSSFEYFSNIFSSYNETINVLEVKYSEIFTIFIELIAKLSLIYYQNNTLKEFIEILEKLIKDANQEEITLIINELIQELKNIQQNTSNNFYEKIKKEILKQGNSEIKQRLYLSYLLIKYFKENSYEILTILLGNNIHLTFLTNEAFGILKTFLKEIKLDYLDEFFLISKLFYKIIVSLGIFNNLDCLKIIGDKIKEISKIPNYTEINKLNDSMEYLIFSFQEIMINNQKIKSYEGPKNLLLSVILKNNYFINCISHGLLFLSKKKIIFEKKFLDLLKNYLIKNESENILQTLIMQYKYQPNILSHSIKDMYDILIFYQKLANSTENQKIIFEFLLEQNNEIFFPKDSILSLENYCKEGNIHPLFYILIEKIHPKFRGIFLSQQLFNYKEKKYISTNKKKK